MYIYVYIYICIFSFVYETFTFLERKKTFIDSIEIILFSLTRY